MATSERTLIISPIGPDNFQHRQSRWDITDILTYNKIHIAAVQETHIPQVQNYRLNEYRIITSPVIEATEVNRNKRAGLHEGGVTISIHEELEQHITCIQIIDRGIITLQSAEPHTPETIINEYAPNNGKRGNGCKNIGKK